MNKRKIKLITIQTTKRLKLLYSKETILLIIITLIIISCQEQKTDYFKNEWKITYYGNDENGNPKPIEEVLIKNDSVLSFSSIEKQEFSFPIIFENDSTIILTQRYTHWDYYNDKKRDTTVQDTVLFEFKNLFQTPMLILRPLNKSEFKFLMSDNENLKIKETDYFAPKVNFKIGGYQIGDSISIKDLVNIKEGTSFNEKLVDGNLIDDENVELSIIHSKYIYSIKQNKISKGSINNIIKVINDKVKVKPDTIATQSPFYTEGFKWYDNGIRISLTKKNMYKYYMNEAENIKESDIGSNIKKLTLMKLAKEEIGNDKYYTLDYDNEFLQGALMLIKEKKPQSNIIE